MLSVILLTALLVATTVGATPMPPKPLRELLSLIESSRPKDVDPAFDCGWRNLAAEYAKKAQPWITPTQQKDLFDDLRRKELFVVRT